VQAEKLDVKLPAKLDHKPQKMIDALNEAKPGEFHKIYAEQQVRAYDKAVELFDDYADAGDNAALKQFAANTLPTIEEAKTLAQ
jgi:putative membrane protein